MLVRRNGLYESNFKNKKNRVMPGLAVERTAQYLKKKNKPKEKYNQDCINRKYVINKMIEYIEKDGLSEEEALDKMMKDSVIKEFEYLEKNGLDIKECIRNWAKLRNKNPNRNYYIR